MDFSIVVPFFKAEEYIEQCIAGILTQDYPKDRYETIMVDNNSPDACARIIRRYPDIRLLHESKQGAYAARNRGAKEAIGDIIIFTDPDCIPSQNWLKELADAIRDPSVQIVVGLSKPAGDSSALRVIGSYEQQKEEYILSSSDPTVYWGHTNNMAVKREIWNSYGPFIERKRGADVIFVRQVVDALSCDVVRYSPTAMVKHLEIKGLMIYYKKIYTYGKSRKQYSRIKYARSLTHRERLLVYTQTVQKNGLSRAESVKLFILLFIGVFSWHAGAFSEILSHRSSSEDATA